MCSSPIPGRPSRFRGGICVTVAHGPGLGGGGEWGSWCGGVLAPWWRWFDLSLMSSQHLAAPGLPRPNPRLHNSPRIRMSQFPHCTVRFTHGKSHFSGWAAGSVSFPRLARCHRHRQRCWAPIQCPTPSPGDRSSPTPRNLPALPCSLALAPATWEE